MRAGIILAATAALVTLIRGGPALAQEDVPISKVVTVYAWGAADEIGTPLSKPVTIFTMGADDAYGTPLSKPVTVFALGADDAYGTPFSKPVTVYVTTEDSQYGVPISKVVTIFTLGADDVYGVPLSKPVTVYTTTLPYEDPFSKPVTICVPPYKLDEVALSLRIAAGLLGSTAQQADRYDVVSNTIGRRVTIVDVVRIYALALHPVEACCP